MKPWTSPEEAMADLDILKRHALSQVQPDPQRARRVVSEIHRFKPVQTDPFPSGAHTDPSPCPAGTDQQENES